MLQLSNAPTQFGVLGFEFGNPSVAWVVHDRCTLREIAETGKSNCLTVTLRLSKVVRPFDAFPEEEPWDDTGWCFWGVVITCHPAALVLDLGYCGALAVVVVIGWRSWLRQVLRSCPSSNHRALEYPIGTDQA